MGSVYSRSSAARTVEPVLKTKTISANGTYNASQDNADGYSQVTVNVNQATETKNITANGSYTPSSGKIGFSQVTVNVPQSSRVAVWSGSAVSDISVNLSAYRWVYIYVTDDGSTTTSLLLQVGGDWSTAGGWWGNKNAVAQKFKATASGITFGENTGGGNMRVTNIYGITNLN